MANNAARWVGIAIAVSAIVATAGGLAVQVRNNTLALQNWAEKMNGAAPDRYTGSQAAADRLLREEQQTRRDEADARRWAKQERVDDAQNSRIAKLIDFHMNARGK